MADIDFKKAKEILDSDRGCVLLDVREESEFYISHADGAQCLPVDSIDGETAAYIIGGKNTPVIVYCKTGARAALAKKRLNDLGYTQVYNLGSLVGWPYEMGFGAL